MCLGQKVQTDLRNAVFIFIFLSVMFFN